MFTVFLHYLIHVLLTVSHDTDSGLLLMHRMDTQACVQKSVIFRNNTPYNVDTSVSGLFCVHTNNCESATAVDIFVSLYVIVINIFKILLDYIILPQAIHSFLKVRRNKLHLWILFILGFFVIQFYLTHNTVFPFSFQWRLTESCSHMYLCFSCGTVDGI